MNKISTRFIILLISTVIIISLALTLFSLSYGKKLLSEDAENKLLDELGEFTEKVNTELYAKETYVIGLESIIKSTFDIEKFKDEANYFERYEQELEPVFKEYSKQFLDAYVFFNPLTLGKTMDIWYYDRNGDGKTERMPEMGAEYYLDKSNKDWFFVPIETKKGNWTDPYPGTIVIESTFVSYTRPVIINNDPIAVVGTDFEYTAFSEEIRNYKIFDSGYAFLLNEEFDFIIHPLREKYPNLYDVDDGSYRWIADTFLENNTGIIEYEWVDEKEKILVYSRLLNNWILGIAVNKDEIYSALNSHAANLILTSVAMMGLFSLIGYRFSKMIVDPLEKIVKKVEGIGSGNYYSEISSELLNDHTEIGVLSDAIENMRLSLKDSFEVIKNHNIELDKKIEARTRELKETNINLENSIMKLNETQNELITSRKHEAIGHIVFEIAHRLNTPLGNSITILSYIESINESLKTELNQKDISIEKINELVSDSVYVLKSALKNLTTTSSIITSLQEFSLGSIHDETSEILFSEFLSGIIVNDTNIVQSLKGLKTEILCQRDLKFSSNSYLIRKIFQYLFTFSNNFVKDVDKDRKVIIEVNEDDDFILIDYIDANFTVQSQDIDMIFEPFTFSSFKSDVSGVELYLVYNVVKNGLFGNIQYTMNEENQLHLLIKIPKNGEV